MLIIGIICIIVSILLTIIAIRSLKNTHKINNEIDLENQKLIDKLNQLQERNKGIEIDIQNKENILSLKEKELNNLQNNISKTFDNQKELSQKAFENYCAMLEKQYEEQEQEYNQCKNTMEMAYSDLQQKLIQEADECRAELEKLEKTRTAAIQAQLKEKEIEEKLSFYCLQISEEDLKDIAILEAVKPKLRNERILSMLIWQTFWQKPMTALCNNIIGKDVACGIYKITNQITKECYIGQAVDLATRWKSHAKSGLGIDTPAGNKLYKAMKEYGIQNFSWEILEKCPRAELDEKEKYYIKLYQSKEYGYNILKGIN